MRRYLCIVVTCLLACGPLCAAGDERAEVERIAPKYLAETEVRLWDGTRVDMLTATHAIEVDWAHKHHEAVSQAVWYAIVTHRRPAVLLLIRDWQAEAAYIYRATTVCDKLNILLLLEQVPGEIPAPRPGPIPAPPPKGADQRA